MKPFEPACLASGIGSLPHTDPNEATRLVLEAFATIPFWPQLPKRHALENMYMQFADGLGGLVENAGDASTDKIVVDTSLDFELRAADFYERYMGSVEEGFPLEEERAAGFWAFLDEAAAVKPKPEGRFLAVKGQVTGPISFGLVATDRDLKPLLYHDLAMDIVAKNTALSARWQENMLRKLGAPTIMFLDEPSMASFGSAFFNFDADLVSHYFELATEGVQSLIAVHCCGNTDWSVLMDTHVSMLSFDAFGYSDRMLLYADVLGEFLQCGGSLAVGIVPAQWEQARHTTIEQLFERLEMFYEKLHRRGCDKELLVRRTLITPSCGLGTQPLHGAEDILAMTAQLSALCRLRYGLLGRERI